MKPYRSPVLVLTLTLLAWASTASGQIFRQGDTKGLIASGTMRGTDVAYDSKNGIYLVVEGNGELIGIFTNRSGDALGAISLSGGYAAFPRVEYSPDVDSGRGGFIVTYLLAASPNEVHARIISSQSRAPISADQVVSDGADGGCFFEAGAAVAYSATSRRFLVVYQTGRFSIRGRLLDLNASPISGGLLFANVDSSRDPGVGWNAATDEFGLSYSAFDAGAYVVFRKVRTDGSLATPKYGFGFASGTFNTDVDVNPSTGNYVVVWDGPVGGVIGANAAEFDVNGNEVGHGVVSGQIGGNDNLSLAFNPNSGTFLAIGQTSLAWDVAGVELNGRGYPISGAAVLSCCGSKPGSFYPRVAADANGSSWNVSFSRMYVQTMDQIVGTSSSGGGGGPAWGSGGTTPPPSPTPPPPPPPPPPPGPTLPPGVCPGTDPFVAIGGGTCVNGGWVPGTGSSGGGSTGGCPGSQPFANAVCVGGGWVPGTGSSSGGSTSGCPGSQPFANAVCVNGGWVPGSGSSGGSTSGCPGSQPFGGAVCVGGGWVPGGSSGGSTSACPGSEPFSGAVCVNGGWVPGGSSSGGSTSGCPGSQPFAGAVCVNGGWVPGGSSSGGSTSGCPGSQPFAGAVCVNGGWVPGGSSGSSSSCSGSAPGAGWVCVGSGWVPPDSPLVGGSSGSGGSSCSTPNPFTAIPGMSGVCINGGWVPGRP